MRYDSRLHALWYTLKNYTHSFLIHTLSSFVIEAKPIHTERVCKGVSDIAPLAMHSPTLLLLLQVLGSVIIFGDAFVMPQKKLPLQKDTHHRIILSEFPVMQMKAE